MKRSELQKNKTTILGMTIPDNKRQHVATSILLMITNHLDIGIKGVCCISGYNTKYLFYMGEIFPDLTKLIYFYVGEIFSDLPKP